VQGQGPSTTALLLPMNTRGGSAQAISLGIGDFAREVPYDKVPMLPTSATHIMEVCPWHNSLVAPPLKLAP
jgi:hypothetical protein